MSRASPIRFGSVCSGIEAATAAWQPLGWQAAWYSEIEPFACAVLAERHPDVPNLGDMTAPDFIERARTHGTIDVLVGGTPCQSFSVAGLRGGLADARGNLALRFLQLAGDLRPQWLVWENVPGVLSSGGGRDFGSILGGMAELGYGWAYRILDAQFFGLAQRRNRVFVVGCLGDWRRAASVLFDRAGVRGDPAPHREAGARTAASLTRGADSGGKGGYAGRRREDDTNIALALNGSQQRLDGTVETLVTMPLSHNGKAAGSATNQDAEGGLLVAHSLSAEGFDASEDGTGGGTPLVPAAFQCHGSNVGPMGVLRAGNGNEGGGVPFIAEVAFSGHAEGNKGQPGTHAQGWNSNFVGQQMGVRRLTPVECLRLQGFEDDYLDITYRGKPAADGPKYRAIGNSMAVPVVRWIGERIQNAPA